MRKSILLLAAALLAVGCTKASGNVAAPNQAASVTSPVTASTTAPSKVAVREGDMYLTPSVTTVAAGGVTFTVTNQGNMDHEFVIVSGDPSGTSGDEPGRVSEANHVGGEEGPEIGDIPPRGTKTMSAKLAPGSYTAMCNLPGHFQAGMHFALTVV